MFAAPVDWASLAKQWIAQREVTVAPSGPDAGGRPQRVSTPHDTRSSADMSVVGGNAMAHHPQSITISSSDQENSNSQGMSADRVL